MKYNNCVWRQGKECVEEEWACKNFRRAVCISVCVCLCVLALWECTHDATCTQSGGTFLPWETSPGAMAGA